MWLILSLPLTTAALQNNTFLTHVQGVIKMTRYGDVCFKQWVITEFLAAEKESVTNVHKWSKNVYSVNAVYKSTFSHWPPRSAGCEKSQMELSDTHHSGWAVRAVTHVLLQHTEELIQND
jgi:hypothetical protein